ncbi:MAG TPA: LysR substrate-binding domain-containing protein [Micropepsaceae bacterium]|nr:LysR substrate-binding domain-containing protein [Micropepsaceae bacterium]
MPLPPLNAVRAFAEAARHGSYAVAARTLHVSPSAISRFVKLLEQHLGTTLFQRKPAGLVLTRAGKDYAAEVSAALARIEEAGRALKAQAAEALVIGAGPTLAMRWLIPRLPAFQAAHPDIEVRISTAIEGASPMRDDWHAAIRLGDGTWPGLAGHLLFTADLFPVARPDIAAQLKSPASLAKANLLASANAPDDWPRWLEAAGLDPALARKARAFDYPAFALQAALDGLGVAMARAPFVADDLDAGRLVAPFSLSVPHEGGWYLIHRTNTAMPAGFARFRDWLMSASRMARHIPKRQGKQKQTVRRA